MKRIMIFKCSKILLIEEKHQEVHIGQCVVIGNERFCMKRVTIFKVS